MTEALSRIEGLLALPSPFAAGETLDRFEAGVRQKGLLVFARIDHAAGAAKIGQPLRPTELLIFGHPQGGTPLMQAAQTLGIDLPLKALAWEDASGQVWLGYNDPGYLARRHGLLDSPAAEALSCALSSLAVAAVAG